jgi:hypothetical protein
MVRRGEATYETELITAADPVLREARALARDAVSYYKAGYAAGRASRPDPREILERVIAGMTHVVPIAESLAPALGQIIDALAKGDFDAWLKAVARPASGVTDDMEALARGEYVGGRDDE